MCNPHLPPSQPLPPSPLLPDPPPGLARVKDVIVGVEVVSPQLPKSSLSSFMNGRMREERKGGRDKKGRALPTHHLSLLLPLPSPGKHLKLMLLYGLFRVVYGA